MYYYILNPAAGRGKVSQIEQRLRDRLKELGISGEFAKTTGPADATKMAYAAVAKGANTIVAVGGDGTVNEVINGIKKDNVAVGIVPVGKQNSLAKKLGVYNWQQAAELLASRRLSSFNLMAAGSHYFLSDLSVGYNAHLDKQVDSGSTGLKNRLREISQTFTHTKNFETFKCKLTIDDDLKLEAEMFSLEVTNQKFQDPATANKLVLTFSERPTGKQLGSQVFKKVWSKSSYDQFHSRLLANRVLIETSPEQSVMIDSKLSGRTPVVVRLTEKKIRFVCGRDLPAPTKKPPAIVDA